MTLGTGLYPRDLLLRQMSGGMYAVILSDGREIEPRKRFLEDKVFQGAILEKDATQSIPISLTTIISWPLPVLDTNGFWNAGAPTRLTVPAGVEIVEIVCGWRGVTNVGNSLSILLIMRNGISITRLEVGTSGAPAGTITRGPIPVVEGDYFEFALFLTKANTVFGDLRTFMSLNVEQATT